jgi:hypothetical protein
MSNDRGNQRLRTIKLNLERDTKEESRNLTEYNIEEIADSMLSDIDLQSKSDVQTKSDVKTKSNTKIESDIKLPITLPYTSDLIKFDIKMCTLGDIPRNLYGGAFGDDGIILYYISHLTNNHIISIDSPYKDKYHFIVSDSTYNNNTKGLYIGNGYYSTVIAIECVYPTDKHLINMQKEILVLKLLLVKKRKDLHFFKNWNDRFYSIYREDKLLYKNLIATCYYYGDNVLIQNSNLSSDMSEYGIKVKSILEEKKLVFNIFKYYNSTVTQVSIKIIIILKLFALLYYLKCDNVYIYDFKWQNVGYDTHNNIVLFDYSDSLINKFFINKEYILWNQVILTLTTPCYFRKLIYLKLNLNNPNTLKYINTEFERTVNEEPINTNVDINIMIKTNIIIYKLLKQNNKIKDYGKYYSINFDPLCDKLNSFSAVNIILSLFFRKIDIGSLITKEDFYEYNDIRMTLNKKRCDYQYPWTMIDYICGFHNINDIRLLDIFVNQMLIPLEGIDSEIIIGLKKLFFDSNTETGLFAPDYEDVPDYELILKYLKELTKKSDPIFLLLKKLLDENIGTESVQSKQSEAYRLELNTHFKIKYVGDDVLDELNIRNTKYDKLTYELWTRARQIEKLKNRPINRTEINLKLPPINSKFPQNIHDIDNSKPKWIQDTDGLWITNQLPEQLQLYSRLFDPFIKTGYTQPAIRIFSDTQKKIISKYIDDFVQKQRITLDNIPSVIAYISSITFEKFTKEQIEYIIVILQRYIIEILQKEKLDKLHKYVIPQRRNAETTSSPNSVFYKYLKYKAKYLKLKKLLNEI